MFESLPLVIGRNKVLSKGIVVPKFLLVGKIVKVEVA
jgi:hypothetical protein